MRHFRYLAAAAFIAAFPFLAPNGFILTLGQDIAIVAMGAIGLNILLGLSGQLSLGQAGFIAIAAYASAILSTNYGWPLWLTLPVSLLLCGLAGGLVGLVALRARSHYLAMVTLAFGYVIEVLAQRWVTVTGGAMGLVGVPQLNFGDFQNGPVYFLWIVGAALLLVQMMSDFIMQGRLGRGLHAIKESEAFAATVGIDASLWRCAVFVLSALLAGLSGYFFAHQSGYVGSDAFGLDRNISLLIAVVIGGLGNAYGPVVGAIILVLLNQVTAGLYQVSQFIFGGILLIVMVGFPGGAMGVVETVRQRLRPRRRERPAGGAAPPEAPAVLPAGPPPGTGVPVLELKDVTKTYAGVTAIDSVSLKVMPGTVHALIGPNGAGKSTLINAIAGLGMADSGEILFNGRPVGGMKPHDRARLGLARTFQNLQLISSVSVIENVMLGLAPRRGVLRGALQWVASGRDDAEERAAARGYLRLLGIDHLEEEMPDDLPYGHRKLCELARALAQRPSLLLLDEPVAGLNESEAEEVARRIKGLRAMGMTIFLVEHNMPFVMGLADWVTVIDYGRKIGEGAPAEVQANPAVVSAYLGSPAP